jgi:hypothetical protein
MKSLFKVRNSACLVVMFGTLRQMLSSGLSVIQSAIEHILTCSDWVSVDECSRLVSAAAGRSDGAVGSSERQARASISVQAEPLAASMSLLDGQDDLEAVGELAYQATLWRLCGGTVTGERVSCDIVAVLVPEPKNPYDPNAIAVLPCRLHDPFTHDGQYGSAKL